MSIVCCRVYKDRIEVASDSISVRGYTQSKKSACLKLFQNGGVLIAGVGDAQELTLLNLFSKSRTPANNTEAAILDYITDFAEWQEKKTGEYEISNSYIIVYGGAAYCIDEFMVERILDFEAIGAGSDFALAALYLDHDVEKAAETACELSVLCERPVKKVVIAIGEEAQPR